MLQFWVRCAITTLATWAGSSAVAQEQQTPFENTVFDDAAPTLEDNLPPGATADSIEDTSHTFELQDKAALMAQAGRTISSTMQPFNSMRIKLIQALQETPNIVTIGGRQIALNHPERVAHFYREQQYPTIWTLEHHFNERLQVLQQLVTSAEEDALNPQHYHAQQLISLLPNTDYNDIIAYELLASDAYLSLLGDLANGLVDPTVTHREWNAPPLDDQLLSELFAQGVLDDDLTQPIQRLNAKDVRYQTLKRTYNRLRQSAPGINNSAQTLHTTLKPGMTSSEVAVLRNKLGLAGDSHFYDAELKQAVIDYQSSFGLAADGVVGPSTRELLNQSQQDKLDKIMINMERLRWLPQSLGMPYVLVNIPSFRVIMYGENGPIYETKSVVGRPDRPTPAFIDRLRHIVMSPTWTVPPTIMRKDKLPRLRSNPGAFDGVYEVITPSGKVVAPSSVNWANGGNGYTLRQKPGAHNALGRVKFLFPNKHAIYLHDTPSKNLFNRPNRAYSSGCVRLQDPLDFANVLLQGTQWTPESIRSATHQSRERWVDPPQETPIYLVYWTMWATPDGNILQAPDIYNLDKKLLRQYNNALTNP
ncbi:L,D-transpeptidase family protein [Cardiobacteriaceae bacterium TAE3-ERU3]|nr:L,D-transpeptidase family protein [Cardiobacteriaceae bacterium TAE3-ERU3]